MCSCSFHKAAQKLSRLHMIVHATCCCFAGHHYIHSLCTTFMVVVILQSVGKAACSRVCSHTAVAAHQTSQDFTHKDSRCSSAVLQGIFQYLVNIVKSFLEVCCAL